MDSKKSFIFDCNDTVELQKRMEFVEAFLTELGRLVDGDPDAFERTMSGWSPTAVYEKANKEKKLPEQIAQELYNTRGLTNAKH
jgi:hypothetical protein|tara:strand:- start:2905 stop:3156 length:252 start_codon:yes stop_codon:yes gene_type:complete